jgi:hypothetical protein
MNDLDRMFANNQNSNRMNQLQQIARSTAEVALLAVGIHGKSVLGKAAGNMKSPAAGSIFDVRGKEIARKLAADAAARRSKTEVTKTVLKRDAREQGKKELLDKGYDTLYEVGKKKLKNPKFLQGLAKGIEIVGKEGLSQIRAEVKKQLPPEIATLEELGQGISTTRNILNSFRKPLPNDANGIVNAVSKATLGKADLTHGVVGYADKVLKGTAGPGKNALEAITEGKEQLNRMIGQTTVELLNDTKRMLEASKRDAEDDDRSEADIERMRKA